MSVVGLAQERPDSPQASFALGKQSIVRKFLVKTNSVNDGPIEVSLAIGLPRLFQIYSFGSEFHPYCRCRSIVPQRIRPGSLEWEVTCTYETPPPKTGARGEGGSDGGDGDQDKGDAGGGTGEEKDGEFENPLLALPEVETRTEKNKEIIYGVHGLGVSCVLTADSDLVPVPGTAFFTVGDAAFVTDGKKSLYTTVAATGSGSVQIGKNWPGDSGNGYIMDLGFHPCRASTGEVFVPPPEYDVSSLILTITRNEDILSPHPSLSLTYENMLNSDMFWGAYPGQVKCESITAQRLVKQLPNGANFPYLRASYIFKFRAFWTLFLLDKGNYFMTSPGSSDASNVKEAFKSADGQPIQGLIDGNGGKLAEGSAPVFLPVLRNGFMPFAALNLPNSFQDVQ